jgi:hypothetical protein
MTIEIVKSLRSPEILRELHSVSDVDKGRNSQHHTLGKQLNQASPGRHIHDGSDSLVLPQPPKIGSWSGYYVQNATMSATILSTPVLTLTNLQGDEDPVHYSAGSKQWTFQDKTANHIVTLTVYPYFTGPAFGAGESWNFWLSFFPDVGAADLAATTVSHINDYQSLTIAVPATPTSGPPNVQILYQPNAAINRPFDLSMRFTKVGYAY